MIKLLHPQFAWLVLITIFLIGINQVIAVSVDQRAFCPPESVLRTFPRVTQPSVGIGKTLAKLPDALLYQNEAGDPTGVIVPFGKPLIVYGYSADLKKLFVRMEAPEACGWISTEFVLLPRGGNFQGRSKSPQPLQMRDISKVEEAAHNMLDVKAVVHDLSITGESKGGIDTFQDPRSGRATLKIRLFDVFPVYDQLQIPAKDHQETRYWLVGEPKNDGADLLGWIRQRDVVIWPTRLAVQWNENVTESGYGSPENLKRGLGDITLSDRVDQVDFPNQIARRLPVLEQSPSPEAVANALSALDPDTTLADRRAKADEIIRYYKIATPGKACRFDNHADCLSARDIDLERDRAASLENAAVKIDILILIDATQSMDPYLPSTVRTIERLVHDTESDKITEVYDLRFSIALYGDYRTQIPDADMVDYNEAVPFFKPVPGPLGTSGAMKKLVEHPKSFIFGDIHQDKLEAPYAALIHAVKTANWRPRKEVPLRFIVHIGDAGNRDPGKTCAETQTSRYPAVPENRVLPKSTIRERYSDGDVAEALRNANVIYVPVEIQGGTSEKPTPDLWNRIFNDQTTAILRHLGIDSPVSAPIITPASHTEDAIEARVGSEVAGILQKVSSSIQFRKCDHEVPSKDCVQLAKEQNMFNEPAIVRLVDRVSSEAAGLSSEEIRNIYSREQSIVTMYSPARSREGQPMFTHWVALDSKEFLLLRDLLQKLCTGMSSQDSSNPVTKALNEFAQIYTNEDFTDLTVGEILGKRLGIPNLERTDFSGRTRDEIDDAFRAWQTGTTKGKETWDRWHGRACIAMTFAQLMADGRKVDASQIECNLSENTCKVPEEAETKFRWSVQVVRGDPTFYVPLDVLP